MAAKNNRKAATSRRTTTKATPPIQEETPVTEEVLTEQVSEEGQAPDLFDGQLNEVEDETNNGEDNDTEAPTEDTPETPESVDEGLNGQEDGELDETPAEAPRERQVPGRLEMGEGAWEADGFGNPVVNMTPARSMARADLIGAEDIEFIDHGDETVTVSTDVYRVIRYAGSKRTGKILAYNAGSRIPKRAIIKQDDEEN